MRIARRFLLLVFALLIIFSLVLLLNFTAPNPTGRRYSSETPLTSLRGRDGGDAERILALDLGVPNNNSAESTQCICSSDDYSETTLPAQCNICVFSPDVENYRVPDFVTDAYIAEAKNYAPISGDVYEANRDQFDAFMAMANELDLPLWVFVAVDSEVSPEFRASVEATGGGIVAYFTIPGYVDPTDQIANVVLRVSGGAFVLLLVWEGLALIGFTPTMPKRAPDDPHGKAARKVDTTEQFLERAKESTRRKIDQESARQALDDE
jgi:hypothetical protein